MEPSPIRVLSMLKLQAFPTISPLLLYQTTLPKPASQLKVIVPVPLSQTSAVGTGSQPGTSQGVQASGLEVTDKLTSLMQVGSILLTQRAATA